MAMETPKADEGSKEPIMPKKPFDVFDSLTNDTEAGLKFAGTDRSGRVVDAEDDDDEDDEEAEEAASAVRCKWKKRKEKKVHEDFKPNRQ